MFVMDTNSLIYFFKGMGSVASVLLSIPPQEVAIPTIVLFELEVGIAKSTASQKRRQQLSELTSVTKVLPFGIEEATVAADIRVKLEQRGNPIGPYDILIAATAISNNGTLVTHNVREFERVEGLQLVDWYGG